MTDKSSQIDTSNRTVLPAPDTHIDAREVFGIDIDMQVPAFSTADE
ncbi:MAG: cobaltochelatase subunit CobS, partial [Sphingomonadales bacterium]|nr:cobaltochelatase subunit CobS [Sphingomonadales bacterium]